MLRSPLTLLANLPWDPPKRQVKDLFRVYAWLCTKFPLYVAFEKTRRWEIYRKGGQSLAKPRGCKGDFKRLLRILKVPLAAGDDFATTRTVVPEMVANEASKMMILRCLVVLSLAAATVLPCAYAQRDCTVTNRGWLTSGPDRGVQPTGLFGPLGLHGEHKLISEVGNTGVQIRVAEVFNDANGYSKEGGMEQTGSSSYDPFKVGGNGDLKPISYYPGRLYRVGISCTNLCSFLGSVEKPAGVSADSTEARIALQVGTNTFSFATPNVEAYKGIYNYTASVNTMPLQTSYDYYWAAPTFTEIGYQDLTVSVTVVQDKTATCEGKFYEYGLPSLLTCGDGIKDQLEECDDGNTVEGDGCSSDCKIEVGFTCDAVDLDASLGRDTLNRLYKKSVCTEAKAVISILSDPGATALTLTEGSEATYTIKLSTTVQEGKEVFVSLSNFDAQDIKLSKLSLRFDSTNAEIAQPIIVTAIENNFRDMTKNFKINHVVSSTDENYGSVTIPDLDVTVLDDDIAMLEYSTKALTVIEGGSTGEFDVKLTTQPYGTVIVSFAGIPDSQLILNPSQLAFAMQDWNQTKTISIVAINNKVVEGKTSVTVRPSITAPSDAAYEALNSPENVGLYDVTVQVEDNDVPGLQVSPMTMSITEGNSGTYTISLRSQMKTGTEVNVQLHTLDNNVGCDADSELAPDGCIKAEWYNATSGTYGTLLVFNESDWNVEKEVRVTYPENDYVEWRIQGFGTPKNVGQKTYHVEHSITSDDPLYNDLQSLSALYPYKVSVEITDNDIPGIFHPEVVTLTEGSTDFEFPMKLLSIPSSEVTVQLSLVESSTGIKFRQDNKTVAGTTVSVNWQPMEWNTTKSVFLAATYDDSIKLSDFTTDMTMQVTSLDVLYGQPQSQPGKTIEITVVDDDAAEVKLSLPSGGNVQGLSVTEGGAAETFMMFLGSQPITNVTVKLVPSAQVTVSPSTIFFDKNTWSTKTTVSVQAVDDTIVESPSHLGTIRFEIQTTDTAYQTVQVPDLSVAVVENDFAGVEREVGPWGAVISPTDPSGAVTLNIPSGVLREATQIKLTETEKPMGSVLGGKETVPGSDNSYNRVSGTYTFEPHNTIFDLPVFITLQYSQEAFESVQSGSQVRTRLVFLRNSGLPGDTTWQKVSGGKFVNGIATIATTSFSSYKVAVETDPLNPAEAVSDAGALQGLAGQDIAKCINGFELTSVNGASCGFKYDDQISAPNTNNIQVTVVKDEDDYRVSLLVIILFAALGLETIIIVGLIVSLNSKKAVGAYASNGSSNAIVPVPNPANGGALISAKIP